MDICRKLIEPPVKGNKIAKEDKKDTKDKVDKTSKDKRTKTKEKIKEIIKIDIKKDISEVVVEECSKTEKDTTNNIDKIKYSKEEKAEYFKNQMEELKYSIEDKIRDFLENSEELKNFIKFKNKHFKSYSFRNSLLIYNQFPTASYVAGFTKWRELGYTVNKGSKSIKILVPLIKKADDKQSKDKQEIYGFKAVSVFDLSQVKAGPNAEPIPSLDMGINSTENMQHSEEVLFKACKTFNLI